MRILIGVSSALDRGSGISAATRGLCAGLQELGHDIVLASPAFTRTEWLAEHGVQHVLTDPNEPQVRAARRILDATEVLSVQAIVNNDNSALQSIAPLVSVPFASIMHLPTHAIGALAGHNAEHVDYVVAISPDMQANARKRFGLPVHRVPLIYNGIADSAAHIDNESADDKSYALPLRVIFAGGGNRRKGADLMLEFLRATRPDPARLVIDWFDVVPEAMERELRSFPCVALHGRVPAADFVRRLSQAHIVLLPSRVEGCPMALLEALCHGVVPIVSDGVGAMKWIVQSGYNGFVCSLGGWAHELGEILDYCSRNHDMVRMLARHARSTFVTKFTNRHVATSVHQLLCAPTIDRTRSQAAARVLKWTRPAPPDGSKPNLWERVCYRTGLLRTEAQLNA